MLDILAPTGEHRKELNQIKRINKLSQQKKWVDILFEKGTVT